MHGAAYRRGVILFELDLCCAQVVWGLPPFGWLLYVPWSSLILILFCVGLTWMFGYFRAGFACLDVITCFDCDVCAWAACGTCVRALLHGFDCGTCVALTAARVHAPDCMASTAAHMHSSDYSTQCAWPRLHASDCMALTAAHA